MPCELMQFIEELLKWHDCTKSLIIVLPHNMQVNQDVLTRAYLKGVYIYHVGNWTIDEAFRVSGLYRRTTRMLDFGAQKDNVYKYLSSRAHEVIQY